MSKKGLVREPFGKLSLSEVWVAEDEVGKGGNSMCVYAIGLGVCAVADEGCGPLKQASRTLGSPALES
eukprot:4121795-Prorocentrum_lima.AAC.1